MASYGAAAGMEVNVFMPKDVPEANYIECKMAGANTTLVDGLISDCGRIVAERKEQEAAKAASGDGAGDDETLSEEEEQMGVQIHRIAVRVAGRTRNILYKVMPDADDASKFVIVHKDLESGEMVPVRRRGQKRFVQRGRDGWELA